MAPLIEENISGIQVLCKRHQISRMYVFGSAARNEMAPKSDVDFLYEIDNLKLFNENPEFDFAGNFWALELSLGKLLNRKIQLLPASQLQNPYLLKAIDADKKLLYAA